MLRVALIALTAGLALQQAPKAPAPPAPAAKDAAKDSAAPKAPALLKNVVFIGASATAGFGVLAKAENHTPSMVVVPLAASFAGAVTSPCEVHDLGAQLFFLTPGASGRSQMSLALEKNPSLVVAVDYLFWYVYGDDDGRGHGLNTEAGRLEKLELGLQQLDRLGSDIPLVISDIPDMSLAVGKMLGASQMPQLATLKKANERIREWAEKRGHVLLFPLSEVVEKLKSGKPITVGGVTFESDKGKLMQSDDLHPTLRGSVALAFDIAERMNATFAKDNRIALASDEATATKRTTDAAIAIVDERLKPVATPAR